MSFIFFARFGRIFALVMAAMLVSTSQAAEAKRLALVIGNDDYQYLTKLEKAGNDASAMARELRAAGFEVELQRDVNYRKMSRTIDAFVSRISGGDQVVVFYAGHGVQIKSGNYLLPIDLEKGIESEIERFAYSLDDLTAKLADAKASFSLVMVDACRNNPIKVAGRSIGASKGLASVEPPKGQMVVFSASRGQEALDKLSEKDTNPNGVFTREFIARMKTPGIKIQDLMVEVQDAVEGLAKSVSHEQRPALYNESRGNFYFYGGGSPKVTVNNTASGDAETDLWKAVEQSGKADDYSVYLQQYPFGKYAPLAKIRLQRLAEQVNEQANNTEKSAWALAQNLNTEAGYLNYLSNYPNAQNAIIARSRLESFKRQTGNLEQAAANWKRGADYYFGRGVAKNYAEATRLYRLAAEQGYAKGQYSLGYMYQYGLGVEKDYKEAVRLYELAAAQGDSMGQYGLGYMYDYGIGVAKDNNQAVKLYALAAAQGYSYAQDAIGYKYMNGLGVPQDYKEAMRYFRLAAVQGYAQGQFNLGYMYLNGQGLLPDEKEAVRLYRLAADQGYANAIDGLGYLYGVGKGVRQNNVVAYALNKLANTTNSINNIKTLYFAKPSEKDAAERLFVEMSRPGNTLSALDSYLKNN
jgi:TPR repeat protein